MNMTVMVLWSNQKNLKHHYPTNGKLIIILYILMLFSGLREGWTGITPVVYVIKP